MKAKILARAGFIFWVALMDVAGADDKAVAGASVQITRLPSDIARLRDEITALVGPASCSNLVNCRIAALGVNACGGAAEFIAYSWRSTDQGVLETKIAEYNFALEDAHELGAVANACTAAQEPVAACVNGRCVISGGR